MATDVPVLVPRRADDGRRDAVWDAILRRRWAGWTVVEGHHEDGLFNRSAALNRAASLAGAWQLAVIADADSTVDEQQLAGAIDLAQRTGRLVVAHSRWVNVTVEETTRFLLGGWLAYDADRDIHDLGVSSMLVVPRLVWDRVNGFDERFEGWGYEDRAFHQACEVLTGPPLRVHGDVFHLAHDRPAEDTGRSRSLPLALNRQRYREYARATTPAAMATLVAQNREAVHA